MAVAANVRCLAFIPSKSAWDISEPQLAPAKDPRGVMARLINPHFKSGSRCAFRGGEPDERITTEIAVVDY